jgi:hypothetical protein
MSGAALKQSYGVNTNLNALRALENTVGKRSLMVPTRRPDAPRKGATAGHGKGLRAEPVGITLVVKERYTPASQWVGKGGANRTAPDGW